MEYNEEDAIAYIREKLGPDSDPRINDDEILNVIDMIWDFYEESGMLDINADIDDEDAVDTEALLKYVKKLVAKDRKSPLTPDDVETIVMAELDYEDIVENQDDEQ